MVQMRDREFERALATRSQSRSSTIAHATPATPGARGGGHFRVTLVSGCLRGRTASRGVTAGLCRSRLPHEWSQVHALKNITRGNPPEEGILPRTPPFQTVQPVTGSQYV